MKKYIFILATTIALQSFSKLTGQNYHWEWAKSMVTGAQYNSIFTRHNDFYNNLYSVIPFDSLLILPDTTFHHPEQSLPWGNCAIVEHNVNGQYINNKSVDIYTLPGLYVYYPRIVTDDSDNMFVACSFTKRLFIQDTVIEHTITPYPFTPDVALLKFNSQHKITGASLIGGTLSDDLYNFFSDENGNIYLFTHHTASEQVPSTISFFNQDTVYSSDEFSSITKIDINGTLLWHNDFHYNSLGEELTYGKNGNLYLWGESYSDIIFNEDTVHMPDPGSEYACFYSVITPDGEVTELTFQEFINNPIEVRVNAQGEWFIYGTVWDTLIIGQDTTIIPEDEYYGFIGKFDQQFQPIWYHIIPKADNQYIGIMYLLESDDNLLFALNCNNEIDLSDTIINAGDKMTTIIGEFDEAGNLKYANAIETTNEIRTISFTLDNCNNPVISGSLKGSAVFGNITISSASYDIQDGFIAKFNRNEQESVYIGPDTTACGEFTIYGPDGYQYYKINDIVSEQNGITVSESGTYYFACALQDGCWLYDTINVTIHPAININIGNDTTISKNDTITFVVSDDYESYQWFDGSTSNSLTIAGDEYGTGSFDVWVQVTDGPCISSDTLSLTITVGIDELQKSLLQIYPNPFNETITVDVKNNFGTIEIFNTNGLSVFKSEINHYESKSIELDLKNLKKGVYFLKINTSQGALFKKIIKI